MSPRTLIEHKLAGGNISYFVVEKEDIQDGRKTIDLLAVRTPVRFDEVWLSHCPCRLGMVNLVESEMDLFVPLSSSPSID